ncbi:MAG: enoyl-CoA hydratase/isomerase family protein [Dehalococcoidia bacterium]
MDFETIILEKEGYIATLTLNRPDDLNALSPQVYYDLCAAAEDVASDGQTRVLVFKGNGRAFCAGADLKEVQKLIGDVPRMRWFVELCHRTYDAIEVLPIPTIASVHGMVLAGGIELAEVCDIIIAAESTRIGDQHAQYGLIAGGGGTQRLIRQMHFRKARELLITGDWLTAKEAQTYGFVSEVVPDDELEEATAKMARKIAERSPMASSCIKMLVNKGIQTDLHTALQLEKASVQQHYLSEDFAEGVNAFVEKRKPNFPGR